jgi:hypothetical protein
MPVYKPFQIRIPQKKNYSQNFVVNTVMVGYKAAVGVTQGKLFVVKQTKAGAPVKAGGSIEEYLRNFDETLIQTRYIKVGDREPIYVDVLEVESDTKDSDIIVLASKLGYDTVEIVFEDQVQLLNSEEEYGNNITVEVNESKI